MSQPIRLASPLAAPGGAGAVSRWLGARLTDAAEGCAALSERLRPRRRPLFVEQPDATFLGVKGAWLFDGGRLTATTTKVARSMRGASVEFRLSPQRCVFRELELPARAGEFLEGVVRAQIDRLTPWRASEAAFGWSAPVRRGADRILVTIAVTKREPIAGLLEVAADAVVVTTMRDGEEAAIQILSRRAGASSRRRSWRLLLMTALAVSLLADAGALTAEWTLGANVGDQADALTASLAQRRAVLLHREHAGDDPAAQALDARKHATPSAVIVLEALSRAIPDDAYLTELRLKADKVEISGVAAHAAGLIKQMEQSPHFSRATFTAPTTRSADDRESFRIEAHVAPLARVAP